MPERKVGRVDILPFTLACRHIQLARSLSSKQFLYDP